MRVCVCIRVCVYVCVCWCMCKYVHACMLMVIWMPVWACLHMFAVNVYSCTLMFTCVRRTVVDAEWFPKYFLLIYRDRISHWIRSHWSWIVYLSRLPQNASSVPFSLVLGIQVTAISTQLYRSVWQSELCPYPCRESTLSTEPSSLRLSNSLDQKEIVMKLFSLVQRWNSLIFILSFLNPGTDVILCPTIVKFWDELKIHDHVFEAFMENQHWICAAHNWPLLKE